MLRWKVLQAIGILAMVAGAARLGVPTLRLAASDVIAACSVLAAFLVQVMLLLATILVPGRLGPQLFAELAKALDDKQMQAFQLFIIYIFALAGFLAIKLTGDWNPSDFSGVWASRIGAAIPMFFLSLAVCRTVGFLSTMRTLQTLRHKLLNQEMTVEALRRPTEPAPLQDHEPEPYSPAFGGPARR